jgi:hypothetical protein
VFVCFLPTVVGFASLTTKQTSEVPNRFIASFGDVSLGPSKKRFGYRL